MLVFTEDHKTGNAVKSTGKEEKKTASFSWRFRWDFPPTSLERELD